MAAPLVDVLSSALTQFKELTKQSEEFLSTHTGLSKDIQICLKSLYDSLKEFERKLNIIESDALPLLIIDNFDIEQIWQELELQNNSVINKLLEHVATVSTGTSVSFASKHTLHEKRKRNTVVSYTKVSPTKKSARKKKREETQILENNYQRSVSKLHLESEKDNGGSLFNETTGSIPYSSDDSDNERQLKEIKLRLDDIEETNVESDDFDFDFGDGDTNAFNKDNTPDANDDDDDADEDDDDHDKDGSSDSEHEIKKSIVKKLKPSIVDDEFFKLSEMEMFLDQQDALEMKDDESNNDDDGDDEVNIFSDLESSDDENRQGKSARKLKYNDYFAECEAETKPPKSKPSGGSMEGGRQNHSVDDGDSGQDDGDGSNDEVKEESDSNMLGTEKPQSVKSSFEIRQEKLKAKILEMEEASLSQKPWQLTGEVYGFNRPENSLLAETVQFEHTTRLPPVITEETTQNLESIIMQRIKDKAWDDVERKVKNDNSIQEYRKRITLDQEKSKQSLSQIYEQEYIRQQQTEEQEKKDPDHEKIRKSMRDLFIKLDALTNFHFTPKPAAPDLVIVSNQPSITMEEVAPVSMSHAQLLAPEEIHEKKKGELKSNSEKTRTDKKRERRDKKAEKRAKIREKEKRRKVVEKINPGLGNKYSKERLLKELERQGKGGSSVKLIKDGKVKGKKTMSSKTFFSRLQEEVKSQKQRSTNTKHVTKSTTSSKFKL